MADAITILKSLVGDKVYKRLENGVAKLYASEDDGSFTVNCEVAGDFWKITISKSMEKCGVDMKLKDNRYHNYNNISWNVSEQARAWCAIRGLILKNISRRMFLEGYELALHFGAKDGKKVLI